VAFLTCCGGMPPSANGLGGCAAARRPSREAPPAERSGVRRAVSDSSTYPPFMSSPRGRRAVAQAGLCRRIRCTWSRSSAGRQDPGLTVSTTVPCRCVHLHVGLTRLGRRPPCMRLSLVAAFCTRHRAGRRVGGCRDARVGRCLHSRGRRPRCGASFVSCRAMPSASSAAPAEPWTDGQPLVRMPADRPCPAGAPRQDARAGQEVRHPRTDDQRTPRPRPRTAQCPGIGKGDLIIGLNSSAIGTLVERTPRFTMLLHLPPMEGHRTGGRANNGPALAGHGAGAVRDATASQLTTLPEQLRRSLTWDQGAEMSQHAQIRIDTRAGHLLLRPPQPLAARQQREHCPTSAIGLPVSMWFPRNRGGVLRLLLG
jgi:hypothetical protein